MIRVIVALALSVAACNYIPSAPEQHERPRNPTVRAGASAARDEGPTPANSPEL